MALMLARACARISQSEALASQRTFLASCLASCRVFRHSSHVILRKTLRSGRASIILSVAQAVDCTTRTGARRIPRNKPPSQQPAEASSSHPGHVIANKQHVTKIPKRLDLIRNSPFRWSIYRQYTHTGESAQSYPLFHIPLT